MLADQQAPTAEAPVAKAPTADAELLPARPAEEGLDTQPEDLVEIGIIRSAHGLRGEMKVEPLTSTPEERLGTPGLRLNPRPSFEAVLCYQACNHLYLHSFH